MLGIPSTSNPMAAASLSAANGAAANWIITTHPATTPAEAAANAIAVAKLLDPAYNTPLTQLAPNELAIVGSVLYGADVAPYNAQADALISEARAAVASPPSVQPLLALDSSGRAGTVTSTGTGVAGRTATYALNGPATFSNGTTTTGPAAGVNFPISGTSTGRTSVTETVSGIPGPAPTQYTAPFSQTKITAGPMISISGQSGDVQMIFDFQPVATSTAGRFVEGGQPLVDILHVNTSDGNPNSWAFVKGGGAQARFDIDWYYSPVKLAPAAQVPAAVLQVASGTGTATGPGDVTVTADKNADKAGYYYPVARFSKAAQPADLQQYFRADWTAGFNDPGEQTIQKYQPEVVTKASVIEAGRVHDVITVTGNEPGKELSVTTDLILTSSAPVAGGTDAAPADAEIIGTLTTKVTGNGEFKTAAVDVPWEKIVAEKWAKGQKASLYFSEKIAGTESTKAWDGKELLPAETVPLEKPSIVTKASENGAVPLPAHDTGVVSGAIPSGTGVKVTTKAAQYKFDDSTDGSAQAVCDTPSWTSTDQNVTTTGEHTYPSHTIAYKGTYGYVEELNLTIDKGPGKAPFTAQLHKGKCGEKNETVIAFPEAVTVTPEKPVLMVNAGFAPNTGTAPEAGPNMPLLIAGGTATALALLAGGGLFYRKRFANNGGEPDAVHSDDLTE